MKKKLLMFIFPALVAGTVFTSCKPDERKLEKDQENIRDAENKFAEDWAKYKQEQEEKIRDNEAQITSIRERLRTSSDKDKIVVEQRANELEQKNKAMRVRIEDYDREKRQDKWEEFKREFNHDMDELGNSLKDINKNNVK
jgi:hypothetical protein